MDLGRGVYILGAVLAFMAFFPAAWARDESLDEEVIGHRLAKAMIESAEAYSRLGQRNWIACTVRSRRPDGVSVKEICEAEVRIVEHLTRAAELRASWGGFGPEYPRTMEAEFFRVVIDEGLTSESEIVRLHLLLRLYDFCEVPQVLSREGKTHCPRDVERACQMILESDSDPLNRQVGLEILRHGYASTNSMAMLAEIAGISENGGKECVRVFEDGSESEYKPPDLDALRTSFGLRSSQCEKQLAQEILTRLQSE